MKITKTQLHNLEDHYCIMYALLGRNLIRRFGYEGEAALRDATRQYGQDRGLARRKAHLDAGLKINMLNLFTMGGDLPSDGRTERELQRINAQERVSHTLTCPMADIWDAYGCMDIGRIYCEEFHYACYSTYGYGYTRVNIATTLTQQGDQYCAFNVVLRPQQLPAALRSRCFEEYDPGYLPPQNTKLPVPGAQDGYRALWLKLYYYLLKASVEHFGAAGSEAMACGLEELAQTVTNDFVAKAPAPGLDYLQSNYPLQMDTRKETMWQAYHGFQARELLEQHFIRVLLAAFAPCQQEEGENNA